MNCFYRNYYLSQESLSPKSLTSFTLPFQFMQLFIDVICALTSYIKCLILSS